MDRLAIPRVTDVPFLATFGELDDLAQTSVELEAMLRYCDQGYRIEYHNCEGLGHVETAGVTLPYMVRWTADRLAGVEWDESAVCKYSGPVNCDDL